MLEQKISFNFLLLGYGGGQHEGTYLTDSMILAHLDLKKNKVFLISLPRDLWIKIPTKSSEDFHLKINALYQFSLSSSVRKNFPNVDRDLILEKGFPNLISYAVNQTTGLTIDNFVAVDFSGFKKAIDALGGVDVNVVKSFDDPEYPIAGKENDLCGKEEQFKQIEKYLAPSITYDFEERNRLFKEKPELEDFVKNATDSPELAFPCRYEKLSFKAGLTHMNGETALKYVRSRHGIEDGGDFGRAGRQQQFILAVKNKVINIGFITKIIPLMDSLKDNIKTDVSPELIKKLMGETPSAQKYTFSNLILSDQNYLTETISSGGQYVLIPKTGMDRWKEVRLEIKNFIAEITPAPTFPPVEKDKF